MTPAQLVASLHTPREITIHSDATLVSQIKLRQQARAAKGFPGGKAPVVVSAFDPFSKPLVSPAELLLCTGLATTPLVALPVALSSQWAYYRYMWAFDPSPPRLRLEASVKEIDHHQKTVLSDELGVGMTHWVMTALLGATSHVDVQVAVKAPSIAQQHGFPVATLGTGRSPDLLYRFDVARFAVVECKGSQSDHNQTLKQLTSGLEQVPSLRIQNQRLAEEYVVATRYGLDGTHVYIVDPPDDDEAARSGLRGDNAPTELGATSRRLLSAPDAEGLRSDLDRLYAAKLLAFAGDAASASELAALDDDEPNDGLTDRATPLGAPETLTLQDAATGLGLFGQQASFPVRGAANGVKRVDVFQGVVADLLPALRDGDIGAEPVDRLVALLEDASRGYLVAANAEEGEVTVVSRDGAALRIRLA